MAETMRVEVLRALAEAGTSPSYYETLRLYHATSEEGAAGILEGRQLLPALPEDPAERILAKRGGGAGSVYVASSPSIADELPTGQVVLAIDVPEQTPAEIVRTWGEPPRIELELRLKGALSLPWVDRFDRVVRLNDLSAPVREAVAAYVRSPVGQQIQQEGEAEGRCSRASRRFLSALRDRDPVIGRAARVLEWGGEGGWHHAVLLEEQDAVLDFTSRQFPDHDRDPFPLVRTRAQAEHEWGPAMIIDMDSNQDRFIHNVEPLLPWEVARRCIQSRGSEQERLFRQ